MGSGAGHVGSRTASHRGGGAPRFGPALPLARALASAGSAVVPVVVAGVRSAGIAMIVTAVVAAVIVITSVPVVVVLLAVLVVVLKGAERGPDIRFDGRAIRRISWVEAGAAGGPEPPPRVAA